MSFEEEPPFANEPEPERPDPDVGDVWCRKEYATLGNSAVGRVDVTDVMTIKDVTVVKFVPRYGAQRGQTNRLPLVDFKKHYVVREKAR